MTGIGRFAAELIERKPPELAIREIRRGAANAAALSPLMLGAAALPRYGSRAFWSPGFMPPCLPSSMWQSVTVHDLTHLHLHSRAHAGYYNAIIRPLLRRMDCIFTVSQYSRDEIIAWANVPETRVVAIWHGLDQSFCPVGSRLHLDRPYVLYVGNRRPNKNLPSLIAGFARSDLARLDFVLALSGVEDAATRQLTDLHGITRDVRYLGRITERDLPATYRGAHAVAFVSLYEGFGFPIIEGMGCGVPVVTSATSSMPEVAGGAAWIVNDPMSFEEIAEALSRACTDSSVRARLIATGLIRSKDFDWTKTAAGYWDRITPQC